MKKQSRGLFHQQHIGLLTLAYLRRNLGVQENYVMSKSKDFDGPNWRDNPIEDTPPVRRGDRAKVLRSVFLDSEMDEILRQAAFRLNVSKGDLIRTYVEQGINAERSRSAVGLVANGATDALS
jgi:hypothetical protein